MAKRKPPRPDRGAGLRRGLKLIGLLVTGEHTIEELAGSVDRDVRTVYRDLAALDEIGIPVTLRESRYSIATKTLLDAIARQLTGRTPKSRRENTGA